METKTLTNKTKSPEYRTAPNDIGKVEIKAPFDWGDHHFTMPAWNELVIYELHVSSFNAHKGERLPGIFYNLIQNVARRVSTGWLAI